LCDVGRVAVKHCFKLLSFLHLSYSNNRKKKQMNLTDSMVNKKNSYQSEEMVKKENYH